MPKKRANGEGDVCERRRWRKKRAKKSGSGQNSVSACEQRILGTTTGAGARRATEGSSAETFAERIIPGQYFPA